MQVTRMILLIVLLSIPQMAAADCEQICYPGLPCQGTEISGERTITGDLCAGDLVLLDGARLILQPGGDRLISVERTLKVVGSAQIVSTSCSNNISQPPKAKSPDSDNPYDRGPHSSGRGDATEGRNGPDGGNGDPGADGGAKGEDASTVRLAFADFSGGSISICARGGDGSPGQEGGDGAAGGDGEQGGRGIPGQPVGCGTGPAEGGNGGNGGNAGRGGNGGNGGAGGTITLLVPPDSEAKVREMLSKQVVADVSGGRPGGKGKAGRPGAGGRFGYGGRGSRGCSGREEERKGKDGTSGGTAVDGIEGQAGSNGKIVVSTKR
jgi:hypothetical protein